MIFKRGIFQISTTRSRSTIFHGSPIVPIPLWLATDPLGSQAHEHRTGASAAPRLSAAIPDAVRAAGLAAVAVRSSAGPNLPKH
jgi:hypothetical protein